MFYLKECYCRATFTTTVYNSIGYLDARRQGFMKPFIQYKRMATTLIYLLLVSGFWASYAQAGLVPTQAMINVDGSSYSRADLHMALESDSLKAQLQTLGVDVEQLDDRIASLTPGEIQQLNSELEQQPAGGIVGALVTIFVVLVVTDMLCATDVFSFVKCIN